MDLNDYRDKAAEFLTAIGARHEPLDKVLAYLDEETGALKDAATRGDLPKLNHQTCDVLFLLFELAARHDLDLNAGWARGRERKRKRYLGDGP